MADLLVDTDVCIDHLAGTGRLPRRRGRLAYSTITRAELFAGPVPQLGPARRLLAPMRELHVDRQVAERAGTVRREVGIRLPDALIAATALVHDLALLTRNLDDFQRVPELRLEAERIGREWH
ncbi:MAG TPA: PIN domain-containing protein [Acidimicrobiales bacterium]|nr:PIN domain-containing protein [Acidimicrobiales bacterium]